MTANTPEDLQRETRRHKTKQRVTKCLEKKIE